jgi:hypothetical protein
MGLRVTSDATVFAAPDVTRTIVLSFLPAVTALGHVDLVAGDATGAPLFDVVRDAAGFDYIRPPQVVLTPSAGGKNLVQKAIVNAFLDVAGFADLVGGGGYSAGTTVKLVGGVQSFWVPRGPGGGAFNNINDPDGVYVQGVVATAHPTIVAGVITAITPDTPGSNYVFAPQVVIIDPAGTGSGASARAVMEVAPVFNIVDPGVGYIPPAPALVFNPWFKTMFPDTSDQRAPFWDLFTEVISRATLSPVIAAPPVVA